MSEGLRDRLRQVEVPGADVAERRGLAVIEAAFTERPARRASPAVSLPRLAIALALTALAAGALLSPAGAAVRDWVDEVFAPGAPERTTGLAEIPGGGQLLVQSGEGPWIVRPNGARRLLGDYAEASWSPRGLFVAAVAGRDVTAVEPDGTPRWTLSGPAPVADPRWSPSGYRIAYRSGAGLRVTAADGSGDHGVAPRVAAIPPAWSPTVPTQLAFIAPDGTLQIADSESGDLLAEAPTLPALRSIEWSASGTLLERSDLALQTRPASVAKMTQGVTVGAPRRLPLPARATVRDAAISPNGEVAAALSVEGRLGPRGLVLLFRADGGRRRLLAVPGRISQIVWSPDGSRLLVAWPSADQWLVLPTGRGEGRAITDIAAAFSPGQPPGSFPRVEGWCCASGG